MDSWGWLEPRAAGSELLGRQFGNGNDGSNNNAGFNNNQGNNFGQNNDPNSMNKNMRGFRSQSNSTIALINEIRWQSVRSVRTSTIILSVFNIVVAFATAVGILWVCYMMAKRNNPRFKFRSNGFNFISAPEIFPLVLSSGIVVQGIVFAVAQSTALDRGLVLGCTITSQMMLPAVLITPFIQTVFGVELAARSLGRTPFQARRKWNVSICLALVGTFLLTSYIVTLFSRPSNFCFGSLFWFVEVYSTGCFGVFVSAATLVLISAIIIFVKLRRSSRVEATERVAASRMVYYLAVAFVSMTLTIPFFFNVSFKDSRGPDSETLQLSLVASVVNNVTGLMTGGLHLFLRSNTIATIEPTDKNSGKGDNSMQNFKRGIRIYSPSSGSSSSGNTSPTYGGFSPSSTQTRGLQRSNTSDTTIEDEKAFEALMAMPVEKSSTYKVQNPLGSNAVYGSEDSLPQMPEAAKSSPAHARKGSYSIFPSRSTNNSSNAKTAATLQPNTYTPYAENANTMGAAATLMPPPTIHSPGTRHKRDSSLASSATVQIGLRFSNVDDMPPLNSKYFNETEKVHTLGCPNVVHKDSALALSSPLAKRPSPLANVSVPRADDDDGYEDELVEDSEKDHLKDCVLNPTVYDPNSSKSSSPRTKVTSPKGVGFSTPLERSNSSSVRSGGAQAPPPQTRTSPPESNQRDWI